jgi:hypothetical protein
MMTEMPRQLGQSSGNVFRRRRLVYGTSVMRGEGVLQDSRLQRPELVPGDAERTMMPPDIKC